MFSFKLEETPSATSSYSFCYFFYYLLVFEPPFTPSSYFYSYLPVFEPLFEAPSYIFYYLPVFRGLILLRWFFLSDLLSYLKFLFWINSVS